MNDFKNIDNQLCDSDGIRTRTVIPDQGIFLPHLLLHKLTYNYTKLHQYFYLYKLLWSGLFYYHIRNLASKYIRFNPLISANLASLILNIQFLT